MMAFTPERKAKFESLVKKYEIKASAILPTLYLAQEQWGYLTDEVMNYVGELLDLPPRHVREVASFYVLLRKEDRGEYCLQVCNNITCCMMGSEDLLRVIKEELNLEKPYQLTADRKFSLLPVQCLGSCDTAPVVQVNEDYYEKLTPDTLRALLQKLKVGEKVLPGRQT